MTAAVKRRSGKPDANMPAIRDYLRKRGCWVYTMPPDAGFDLLVGNPATWALEAWEIKDGGKAAAGRKLTAAELGVKREFSGRGFPYYIVESIKDADELIEG